MQAYLLLCIAALLIVVLVELIQSRKRQEDIAAHHIKQMRALYQENHALENKAQAITSQYEQECG